MDWCLDNDILEASNRIRLKGSDVTDIRGLATLRGPVRNRCDAGIALENTTVGSVLLARSQSASTAMVHIQQETRTAEEIPIINITVLRERNNTWNTSVEQNKAQSYQDTVPDKRRRIDPEQVLTAEKHHRP